MAAPPGPPPGPPKPQRRGDSDSESEAESEGGGFGAALRNEQRELLARTLRLEAAVSAHAADDQLRAKRAVADAAWRHEWKRARAGYGSAVSQGGGGARASLLGAKASLESARQPLLKREALALGARAAAVATSLRSKPAPPGCAALAERAAALGDRVGGRAGKESEIPNFKGSYLGRFPLVSADFWTSDHLSERSRRVDAFSGTRARGTLMLKLT